MRKRRRLEGWDRNKLIQKRKFLKGLDLKIIERLRKNVIYRYIMFSAIFADWNSKFHFCKEKTKSYSIQTLNLLVVNNRKESHLNWLSCLVQKMWRRQLLPSIGLLLRYRSSLKRLMPWRMRRPSYGSSRVTCKTMLLRSRAPIPRSNCSPTSLSKPAESAYKRSKTPKFTKNVSSN